MCSVVSLRPCISSQQVGLTPVKDRAETLFLSLTTKKFTDKTSLTQKLARQSRHTPTSLDQRISDDIQGNQETEHCENMQLLKEVHCEG